MFSLSYEFAPVNAGQTALVMLPGAGMCAHNFRDRGFVHALHERKPDVDAVMVDVEVADYVLMTSGRRLQREVLEPLLGRGYRRIWLSGISIGAYGAMRLLQEDVAGIAGMLLLSPFLATRGTVAHVVEAGGLDGWTPSPAGQVGDDEALLCWLKDYLSPAGQAPKIYLGWGMNDRYADAAKLLAARLPRERVFCIRGDHDWPTWSALWRSMLAAASFSVEEKPQ